MTVINLKVAGLVIYYPKGICDLCRRNQPVVSYQTDKIKVSICFDCCEVLLEAHHEVLREGKDIEVDTET